MRLLVVSDSHRDFFTLNEIVKIHPEAEVILHLGDGSEEINKIKRLYPNHMVVAVRGNCDLCSTFPEEEEISINGVKIFMAHGHLYNVKFGISSICAKAQDVNAKILLFGHTHTPLSDYQFGLYILNPGSIRYACGTYGIIDITDSGIVTNILNVNFDFKNSKSPFFNFIERVKNEKH